MSAEISLHNVTKVSLDSVRDNNDWITVIARVHQKDGTITEITLYSATGQHIAIGIGEIL